MTTLQKLEKLYANIDKLHPLSQLMIRRYVESNKKRLRLQDVQYVEDVFPKYFPELKDKKEQT